MYIDVDDV